MSPGVQPSVVAVACALVYALYAWRPSRAFTALVSARLVTAFWYETWELLTCASACARLEADVPASACVRFACADARVASAWVRLAARGGWILGCQHLAGGDRLSRLDVDGRHLARALEVEVGLAVRREVPRQRHRLGHRAQGSRRRSGTRLLAGVAAREQERPGARGDHHDDDADDEWLRQQATSHDA